MKFTRSSEPAYGGHGPGRTQYEAVDDVHYGRHPAVKAQMEVADAYTSSRTSYPKHPTRRTVDVGHETRSRDPEMMQPNPLRPDDDARIETPMVDRQLEGYDDMWARHNSEWGGSEVDGQVPLFKHESQRHSAKVDYLRTTPGARALVGPLLGIAGREQMAKGEALTPSDDLSRHSGRMVEKLNKNLGTQFESGVMNDLTFQNQLSLGFADEFADSIPQSEVDAGRKTMRRVLRSGRPVRDAGYEQMSIFDA